jgi:hypothetical protein
LKRFEDEILAKGVLKSGAKIVFLEKRSFGKIINCNPARRIAVPCFRSPVLDLLCPTVKFFQNLSAYP